LEVNQFTIPALLFSFLRNACSIRVLGNNGQQMDLILKQYCKWRAVLKEVPFAVTSVILTQI
jgi:hypothetical protein